MDARSGMSSRNDNADKNGLAGVTTPTWAPTGAPPEVLVINGRVTDIPLWRARKRRERNTGLLGTDRLAGALWIERCNWIHTFGMRYDIDVVYVNRRGLVVAVATIPRKRLHRPLGDRVRGWDRNQHRDSIWRVSNHYHEQAVA